MFRAIILPIFRSTRLCATACGIMHPRCCRPVAGNTTVVYTTYSLPQHKKLDVFPHCGLAVQLPSFLTSALVGGESSTSRSGRFNPGKGGPLYIARTVGPAAEPVGHRSPISKYSRPQPSHFCYGVCVYVYVFVFVYRSLRPDLLSLWYLTLSTLYFSVNSCTC